MKIWSLYMKQKMRYAIQTTLLSFLMNLFSVNISPSTLYEYTNFEISVFAEVQIGSGGGA
jgi:hypothetical protein